MTMSLRMKHKFTSLLGNMAVWGVCLSAGALSAADFTWLGSPATGNWNAADTNWTGAGSVWVNSPTNNASFGASGTQNLSVDVVSVSNITFNADGYVLGGGSLTLNGNLTVATSQTAVVTTPMAHSWTNLVSSKLGPGTLVLNPTGNGNSNIWGSIKVATGTLQINGGTNIVTLSANNPESGPALFVSGGTLVMGGGLLKTTGGWYARVSDYGTLLITNGLVDLTSNSELLNAHNTPGVTTVSGYGILDLQVLRITQNATAGSAALNVVNVNTGGIIRLNNYSIDAGSKKYGTVNFNGGTSVAKADGVNFFNDGNSNWVGIVAYVLEGGAIIDSNGKSIYFRQALQSGTANDGGLTKKGSGNVYLWGTNSYRGGTFLWAGSLNITNDNNLGAIPSSPATNFTFVGSSTLSAGASHTLAANRTIRIPTNVTATFDTGSYTQTVNGVIYGEDRVNTLAKLGAGMLILDPGPTNGFTASTFKPQAGTTYVRSGSNVVNIASGTPNASGFWLSGGTLLVGGGELKTTGGGYATSAGGTLIITNGVVNLYSANELLNAYGGNGNVTVSGSGVLDLKVLRISQTGAPASANVVNINTGGTIRLNNFYIDAASPQSGNVNFNGGTVVAKIDYGDFLGSGVPNWSNILVYARAGGAVIDTAGKSVSIKQSIYSGAATDGGLTKLGNGTLTLLNTNTYNGATAVLGGTFKLGVATNTLLSSGSVLVASIAVLSLIHI